MRILMRILKILFFRALSIIIILTLTLRLAKPLMIDFGTPRVLANSMMLSIGIGFLDYIGVFKPVKRKR